MFQNTKEYAEIKEEVTLNRSINEKVNLVCYSDNIATYVHRNEDVMQEFNVIHNQDLLIKSIEIGKLLKLKNISYFEHVIYIGQQKKACRVWNMLADTSLN